MGAHFEKDKAGAHTSSLHMAFCDGYVEGINYEPDLWKLHLVTSPEHQSPPDFNQFPIVPSA